MLSRFHLLFHLLPSLSPCIWFSLPSPLPAFLCLYLSSTTLSPTPIYFLIGAPKRLFFRRSFLLPSSLVFAWLQFYAPRLQSFLSPPALPHTTDTPLSMEMFDCFFPPLKPFPDSSSKKKSQLDKYFHFKSSKDTVTLVRAQPSFLTCP